MSSPCATTSKSATASATAGKMNRRTGRLGEVARSIISQQTEDSLLSPNSVRCIFNPVRSQLGLPLLDTELPRTSTLALPISESEIGKLEQSLASTSLNVSEVAKSEIVPNRSADSESSEIHGDSSDPTSLNSHTPTLPVLVSKDFLENMPLRVLGDQNIPPQTCMKIAAIVQPTPDKFKQPHPREVLSPVATKNSCLTPFVPYNLQKQNSKSRYSGWRFPTEAVNGKKYLVMNQLGRGGSGEVLLVMEKITRQLFALKRVFLAGISANGINEYVREVELLTELKDTDLVIHIENWELVRNESLKIVMELGQCDLKKSINRDQRCSVNRIRFIFERMLQILKSIHDRGIVHADLKPANFVWVNGNLKIIDFGIAKKLQIDFTSIAGFGHEGTLNFMSPESVQPDEFGRTKISPKSDIWSLGCILHSMIFGHTPFEHIKTHFSKVLAITQGIKQYPPLSTEFLGSSVISVIQACLEVDPKKRPTADELLSHPFLSHRRQSSGKILQVLTIKNRAPLE